MKKSKIRPLTTLKPLINLSENWHKWHCHGHNPARWILSCTLQGFCSHIRNFPEGLQTRDLTSRNHQNCGDWHRETGQRGTISQGWLRETCFSVRVDTHYQFMFAAGSIIWDAYRIKVFSSISFCFSNSYVRQTARLSWPALWSTFGRTIK